MLSYYQILVLTYVVICCDTSSVDDSSKTDRNVLLIELDRETILSMIIIKEFPAHCCYSIAPSNSSNAVSNV